MGRQRAEAGFTLVEILVATVIIGILFTMSVRMIQMWGKYTARAAIKARTTRVEQDLRRLYTIVQARYVSGEYSSVGPWPEEIPGKTPLPWKRPAPGFEDFPWAPSKSPTHLQYYVDGWATGFNVSGVGDLNKDGALELYRIWGDVGMFEGPLPYQSNEYSPVNP